MFHEGSDLSCILNSYLAGVWLSVCDDNKWNVWGFVQSHKVQHKQGKYQVSAVVVSKLYCEIALCSGCFLFFLSDSCKETIKSIMHKTIYIYRRFFARQSQLKVLNSNKHGVTFVDRTSWAEIKTIHRFLFGAKWIACLRYEITDLAFS